MNRIERSSLIAGHIEWLETFAWQWFCTLTFRGYASAWRADRCFDKWISELRAAEGTPGFGWYRVTEMGATGQDLHFHAFIAGLRNRYLAERMEWMKRWIELAGSADITTYSPGKGGPAYVLKCLNPDHESQIRFEISPDTIRVGKIAPTKISAATTPTVPLVADGGKSKKKRRENGLPRPKQ
jgi:hypothetical protein